MKTRQIECKRWTPKTPLELNDRATWKTNNRNKVRVKTIDAEMNDVQIPIRDAVVPHVGGYLQTPDSRKIGFELQCDKWNFRIRIIFPKRYGEENCFDYLESIYVSEAWRAIIVTRQYAIDFWQVWIFRVNRQGEISVSLQSGIGNKEAESIAVALEVFSRLAN